MCVVAALARASSSLWSRCSSPASVNWTPCLGIGERGTITVIAADRKQARTIMRYVKGLLQLVPMLRQLVEAERLEGIDLSNRITIEVHTCSFRTVRGYTILAALCDEMAFWLGEDSSNPDAEVVAAIKPAMATIPNAILLCASSPYARKGCAVGGVPPLLWSRRSDPRLERTYTNDEPDRVAELHRRRDGQGPSLRRCRVPRAIQNRHRSPMSAEKASRPSLIGAFANADRWAATVIPPSSIPVVARLTQ